MLKIDLEPGGYELHAEDGKELVVYDEEGNETARTVMVYIPSEQTLNNWQEVPAKQPETQSYQEQDKDAKIAALEAELARLKGSP